MFHIERPAECAQLAWYWWCLSLNSCCLIVLKYFIYNTSRQIKELLIMSLHSEVVHCRLEGLSHNTPLMKFCNILYLSWFLHSHRFSILCFIFFFPRRPSHNPNLLIFNSTYPICPRIVAPRIDQPSKSTLHYNLSWFKRQKLDKLRYFWWFIHFFSQKQVKITS